MQGVVRLRGYREGDAAATLEVFQRAVRHTAAQHYDAEQIAAWAPDVVDLGAWHARRARVWTVVAELQGRVIGFADLADGGLLDMLFVHPDAGSRGVARVLVEAVCGHARSRGIARLVTHASRAARPVFDHLGFVLDAENKLNLVRGVRVPNFDMHLDL